MSKTTKETVQRRTWEEFQAAGLLWWVNRVLHLFGWAIVFQVEADETISDVYPARVTFRGFFAQTETEGHANLTKYLKENIDGLIEDVEDD